MAERARAGGRGGCAHNEFSLLIPLEWVCTRRVYACAVLVGQHARCRVLRVCLGLVASVCGAGPALESSCCTQAPRACASPDLCVWRVGHLQECNVTLCLPGYSRVLAQVLSQKGAGCESRVCACAVSRIRDHRAGSNACSGWDKKRVCGAGQTRILSRVPLGSAPSPRACRVWRRICAAYAGERTENSEQKTERCEARVPGLRVHTCAASHIREHRARSDAGAVRGRERVRGAAA